MVDVLVVTQQTAEIPEVMRKQVPTFQKIQNCDKVVEVPVVMQVPQNKHVDKVVNMPVVIQRQVPMTLNVQKSVEVARVIPHERLLNIATVEGPRNVQGEE